LVISKEIIAMQHGNVNVNTKLWNWTWS